MRHVLASRRPAAPAELDAARETDTGIVTDPFTARYRKFLSDLSTPADGRGAGRVVPASAPGKAPASTAQRGRIDADAVTADAQPPRTLRDAPHSSAREWSPPPRALLFLDEPIAPVLVSTPPGAVFMPYLAVRRTSLRHPASRAEGPVSRTEGPTTASSSIRSRPTDHWPKGHHRLVVRTQDQ